MPRILQNETEMTLVLFGGKTWLYPKSSKDPKKPSRVEIKTELASHPDVKNMVDKKRLTVLSLEAAMARQEVAAVVAPVVVETTPITASAPAPVNPVVEATPAAVGTVEDEKSAVASAETAEAPVATVEAAPAVSTETAPVSEEAPVVSSSEEATDAATAETEAPRHSKKNKKNRG